jgi:hypothetical protein
MKNKIAVITASLAILSSINPAIARETNELITKDKLNISRCQEDFSTCSKISEAASVAFGAYKKDDEKGDKDWQKRFEKELKEPGVGWDKGYSKVETVVIEKNNVEFVIAQKEIVIGTIMEAGKPKKITKTYYLVGIRGTQGIWDGLTDLAVAPEKFDDGSEVHGGFNRYATSITGSPEFERLVDNISLNKNDSYEVLITGHSLGGAAATIVKAKLETMLKKGGHESSISKISAITFGAPFVGDRQFVDRYGDRVIAIGADGDAVQEAGINSYPVGKPYNFQYDDKRRLKTPERHLTYGDKEHYDTAVKNGWDDLRNDLMNNQISGITQGSSSRIGSAAYYIGSAAQNDSINIKDAQKVNQFSGSDIPSRQQGAEYVDAGSQLNLKAPVDVVLDWRQSVAAGQLDLDSHLTGPTSLGSDSPVRFHTNFNDKGSITTAPYVQLYKDVIPAIGGSGPEQTRIQVLQDGVYRFYVHDYTNRDREQSPALAQSGANVTVYNTGSNDLTPDKAYDPNTAYGGAINVPTDRLGNVWYSFQLDSRTGILKRVNVPFGNISDRAKVPSVGENPGSIIKLVP